MNYVIKGKIVKSDNSSIPGNELNGKIIFKSAVTNSEGSSKIQISDDGTFIFKLSVNILGFAQTPEEVLNIINTLKINIQSSNFKEYTQPVNIISSTQVNDTVINGQSTLTTNGIIWVGDLGIITLEPSVITPPLNTVISGLIVDETGNALPGVKINIVALPEIPSAGSIVSGEENNFKVINDTLTSDTEGKWIISYPTTDINVKKLDIVFSKDKYQLKKISSPQQTDYTPSYDSLIAIPRITLELVPDIIPVITQKINQDINTSENEALKQQSNAELPFQSKVANTVNVKKEDIKRKLIPFVLQLLLPFGMVALQAILAKLPINEIKDKVSCPNKAKLLELINKRNKLARQINNIYKTVTTLSKTLNITNTAINAIQTGINLIQVIPYPATGIPPIGLPPLTTGIIEITGATVDRLTEELKKARVAINILTITLASLGIFLGVILNLLNILDQLIQQCSEDQNLPFETINNELNLLVNQSTGISNSTTISTVQDNTYKGFTLEIKLDETNTTQYKKRYAQALNKQGVPVLKTESSFASDPQVLVDQLKFIIDSNPNLTAE